ncbi:MAG TPA: peptidylprolyl isomerase [Tepidisphaeraceae bacterium]|jgi:FKBP-type peptidyl-prolyl cis-trans isomerase SlyD
MQIARNTVATIDYTLTDPDGQVLDSSKGGQSFAYLHGAGGIIPGLEDALEGKTPGEQVSVTVPPEQGYGQRDEALVRDISRQAFQGVDQVKPGMQFRAQGRDGQQQLITVVSVGDDRVKIDGNHPLAGITLKFDVDVKDVRPATQDEIAHGHAHSEAGAQHHDNGGESAQVQ